ncbi:MAG: DUF3429 domain-containing protein [Gammaproteobacteria bacterium]
MAEPPAAPPADSLNRTLAWLGYGGLLPFLAGAIAVVTHQGAWAMPALLAYGACILSFLGAVHWGWVMGPAAANPGGLPVARTLALGVLPSLVGWGALLLPPQTGLGLLICGFAGWYLVENRVLGERVLGRGYLALRQRLTAGVLACLVVALVTQ